MAKFIRLIDLDELKALRITCGRCHAYWSVPITPMGNNSPPKKCIYCEAEIPLKDINELSKKINYILEEVLKNWKVSIELEAEK
jgi:hypothetical protein